jgi:hypothetical protein
MTALQTLDQIIQAVRDRVAKDPEVTYARPIGGTCSHFRGKCSDGTTGCIFGQIMPPFMGGKRLKEMGIMGVLENMAADLPPGEAGWCDYDDRAMWCDVVQDKQDQGLPWGKAVAEADRKIPIAS